MITHKRPPKFHGQRDNLGTDDIAELLLYAARPSLRSLTAWLQVTGGLHVAKQGAWTGRSADRPSIRARSRWWMRC